MADVGEASPEPGLDEQQGWFAVLQDVLNRGRQRCRIERHAAGAKMHGGDLGDRQFRTVAREENHPLAPADPQSSERSSDALYRVE